MRTYHASRLFLDNLLEGRKLIQARYRVGHLKAKQSRSTLMFALSSEEKEIQIKPNTDVAIVEQFAVLQVNIVSNLIGIQIIILEIIRLF